MKRIRPGIPECQNVSGQVRKHSPAHPRFCWLQNKLHPQGAFLDPHPKGNHEHGPSSQSIVLTCMLSFQWQKRFHRPGHRQNGSLLKVCRPSTENAWRGRCPVDVGKHPMLFREVAVSFSFGSPTTKHCPLALVAVAKCPSDRQSQACDPKSRKETPRKPCDADTGLPHGS